MRSTQLSKIPIHIFQKTKEIEDLEDKLKRIPKDIFEGLIETNQSDLLFLPFHPSKDVRDLFSEEKLDYIQTVYEAKKANLAATKNYLLSEVLRTIGINLKEEYKNAQQTEIMGILDKRQQEKEIAEIFTSNPRNLLNKTKNELNYGTLLTKVIAKYTELVNSEKIGTEIKVELGVIKGKLKNNFVYFQSKEKTRDSLVESLTNTIFDKIIEARQTNYEYKKETKKKQTAKKQDVKKLSEKKKLALYFETFFLNDLYAFEIGTAEYIPPGQDPKPNGGIETIKKKIEQNQNIRVIEYKDEFHNPKKPRAKQYVLSIPENIQKKILPFPNVVKTGYTGDLRVSVHLKPFLETLKYHFGNKAHIMYKFRKNPEIRVKTIKKQADKKIYLNIFETLDSLL